MTDTALTKKTTIFAFISGHWGGGDVIVQAVDENGYGCGNHLSSSIQWAKRDIGFTDASVAQRRYGDMFPGGFEVVWVDEEEIATHEGIQAAFAKGKALYEAEEAAKAASNQELHGGN